MPDHSRWMIKAGMVWLMLSISLGLMSNFVPWESLQWTYTPFRMVIWHTLVVGWLTQLIFGVSLWMFPGVRRKRKKNETDAKIEWWIFGLLNFGVLVRLITQPIQWEVGILMAGAAQWVAMLFYVIRVWPSTQTKRVRSSKKH